MYYWGYFRNTDTSKDKNGQLYKVVIITDFQNNGYTKEGGELILTSSPFNVNYKGEDDNLFKPYKCSTATVSFYLDRIIKDLYSVRGNDILVTLFKLKDGVTPKEVEFSSGNITDVNYPSNYDYRDYTVEWIGFATPNAFNQSYNSDFNVFEMEAQDALSTLQYYDYTSCTTNNGNNTISNILLNIISSVGIYKNIYISDNLHTPTSDYDGRDITEYLSIYEGNFFNEDGEAKKMLEVLSDIMQYLNMTAVAFGDNLFILDYTAIANKYNIYHWIKSDVTIRRGSMYVTLPDDLPWVYKEGRIYNKFKRLGRVEFKHYKDIELNDIADSNINYSLGSTYNKVKVIDDNYYIDGIEIFNNVLPSPNLDSPCSYANDVTVESASDLVTVLTTSTNRYYIKYFDYDNEKSNLKINTYWHSQAYRHSERHPQANTFLYWDNYITDINDNKLYNYDTQIKNLGTLLVKYDKKELNSNEAPSLKNAIFFCTNETENFLSSSYKKTYAENAHWQQKMLDVTLESEMVNEGDYIIINGDFTYYAGAEVLLEHTNKSTIDYRGDINYIWVNLKCGEKYYDGSSWVDNEVLFTIPLNVTSAFGSKCSIKSNVGFLQNLSKTGYGVKLPLDKGTTSTNITLTFHRDWGLDYALEPDLIVLENFSFEVVSPVTDLIINNNRNNTEYTNVINNSAIEEYNDIKLPITTYNGKDKDYSTVYCCESYLDSTLTPMYRVARYYNTSTGFLCSAEEHIINNITTQYQLPNTIFDITLYGNYKPYSLVTYKHFEDVTFVVDGMSIDYAANNTTLHLVQKIIGSHNRQITLQKRSKKRDYQRNGDIINNALGVKKDDKIITYSYVAGEGNLYRDGMIVSLNAVGDTLIDWDNPLALDSNSVVRQAYLRFNINDNGELNIYYPNSLAPTAKINENGELLVEPIKDGVIII